MAMTLDSPAFRQNDHIPSKYTCEGEDVSPPLTWEGVPNSAKSLVLIVDDPDAPDPKAPKMVWVHWVVYNIPPDTKSLPENAGKARLPQGVVLGLNDFRPWRQNRNIIEIKFVHQLRVVGKKVVSPNVILTGMAQHCELRPKTVSWRLQEDFIEVLFAYPSHSPTRPPLAISFLSRPGSRVSMKRGLNQFPKLTRSCRRGPYVARLLQS
jgi:Phosphatidylethanolamine-binding protein